MANNYESNVFQKEKDNPIGIMVSVLASGPGDRGLIPGRVRTKTQKKVLDVSLLNIQRYKVRIKGKWSSPGKGVTLSLTPQCSSF